MHVRWAFANSGMLTSQLVCLSMLRNLISCMVTWQSDRAACAQPKQSKGQNDQTCCLQLCYAYILLGRRSLTHAQSLNIVRCNSRMQPKRTCKAFSTDSLAEFMYTSAWAESCAYTWSKVNRYVENTCSTQDRMTLLYSTCLLGLTA